MSPGSGSRVKSSKLINMHDFDQLVPLISPNAIFWFNDGSFCGLKQIRQAFEETWKKFPLENYWLENLEWVAQSKDCAGCTYHFRWRAILNGSALEGGGRGTTILRREANVWKITHEHLSQFLNKTPRADSCRVDRSDCAKSGHERNAATSMVAAGSYATSCNWASPLWRKHA